MKNLFVLLSLFVILISCQKEEDYLPEKYKKNVPLILTIENPIKDFKYGYIFKGQATFSFDRATNEHVANYNIAYLYSDLYFAVGDDITAKIKKTDSINFLRHEEERWK
jgi:hypothetical protein